MTWVSWGLLTLIFFQHPDHVPEFSEFPSDKTHVAGHLDPVLQTPFQRQFQTRIRNEARSEPNFAGHYRVAEWGCGTSCGSMALIDLATGTVYDGPFRTLYYGVPRTYEGSEYDLDYKLSSRLMVARGCPDNTDDCGTFYYVWTGDRFRRIRFVPAVQ